MNLTFLKKIKKIDPLIGANKSKTHLLNTFYDF
jgi:hypothetical protein